MRSKEDITKKLSFIGYRKDIDGEALQLYEDADENFHVKYKGKMYPVEPNFKVEKDGFYNQPTNEIPYFVLDNDVYSFESFKSLNDREEI